MIDVRVTWENLEEVLAGLRALPDVLGGEVEQAIDTGLALLAGEMAIYPPAIAGSRYRRTGLLGQLWGAASHRVQRVSVGAELYVAGQIENWRPGIVYVQSGEDQAPVHQGRWRTAEMVVEGMRPMVERLLQAAGDRAVERAAR